MSEQTLVTTPQEEEDLFQKTEMESEDKAGEEEESKERVTREYIILESKQAGVWQEKEKVTAATNDEALEAVKDPQATSKYQAIASRNWSPKSPKVETVTVVRFE